MPSGPLIGLSMMQIERQPPRPASHPLADLREGFVYVTTNRQMRTLLLLLGSSSLFGTSYLTLMPVFARDILHVGAEGLGALRAAPAAGAAIVALVLALRPLQRKVGPWMLWSIVIYGFGTLAFAFSPLMWLSLLALAVTGAADMISVYVRQSLIQFATPDAMRGRVAAVSFIFISASNELGEFESGVAARFLGPVGAVILGGAVAIVTALSWFRLFPQMARADRFEEPAILASEPERLEPRVTEKLSP